MFEQIKIIIQLGGKSLLTMLEHIYTDKPLQKPWVTRAKMRYYRKVIWMYCKAPLPLDKMKCKSQALLFWTCKWSERKEGQRGRGAADLLHSLHPSLSVACSSISHTTLGASLQGGASGWPFPGTREPTPSTEDNSGISKGKKWQQEQRGNWANVQTSK